MARFSDLSPELIMELWEHILHPDDIDSFALVWKHTHATGRTFLEEHRRLKAQDSSIQTCYDAPRCNNPWGDLLRDVLLDPRHGAYVKHLDIESLHSCWQQIYGSNRQSDNCHHVRYSEIDMFENGMRSSIFMAPRDNWQWKQGLERGDEDPILAILLTLLPELRSLKIDSMPLKGTLQTFQYIADSGSTSMLFKLEQVENSAVEHETKVVSVFQAFAMFPSMKKLSCDNFQLDWSHCAAETRMPLQTSNISDLTITGSDPYTKNLFEVLGAFKALERFIFRQSAGCRDFDPFLMRAALLAYARHSLEYLVFQCPDDFEGEECMGSLQEFKKLRTHEIDHNLLVDPKHRDVRLVAFQHGVANNLPRTLEELVLGVDGYELYDQVERSIRSLLEAKTNGHLSFSTSWGFVSGLWVQATMMLSHFSLKP